MTTMVLDDGAFNNLIGLRQTELAENHAAFELMVTDEHLNRSGFLHGGVMSTMLDAALSRSGCWTGDGQPPRRTATLSLTVNFVRAGTPGLVRAIGTCRGGGKSIYNASGEIIDAEGNVLAVAQGCFRYRHASGFAPKA